ncbi:MAG TPA: type IV secretion protein IcmC [Legionella sp.]|nr:type IV secretion protein IcmC [Legionella sp.]
MKMPDLVTMIGNLSQSLASVQSLIIGAAYVLGLSLVVSGLIQCTKVTPQSREKISVPLTRIFGGVVLIFLPTSVETLSNTLFGSSSALEYNAYNPYNIYESMQILIKTAGVLWFVRGAVLMISAAKPGQQHGTKGFAFVLAGIGAMNIEYTIRWIDWFFNYIMSLLKGPI